MPLPKNSLHECKGCEFAVSVQGYSNACVKPIQLQKYKRFHYVEILRETCGEVLPMVGTHGGKTQVTTGAIA